MANSIGKSTSASTAKKRSDISGNEPASFRYNNPGAQYPSPEAASFGQIGYGIIGGGHKIARFPSAINGAASNFDLLSRNYTGMTIGAAGRKWTGAHGFGVEGYDPRDLLSKSTLEDAQSAIALLKAIAGRESGRGNNLTESQWLEAHRMFKAGSADAYLNDLPADPNGISRINPRSGASLLKRAREHLGEEYNNILVPKDNPQWKGPWDCAEFISWLVYQEVGVLYGCQDNTAPPAKAEAYTGAWERDAEKLGIRVSVEEAAATVGGILLRYPPLTPGKMGHIALCDGNGGTVEAKGRRYGVIADSVHGREWDTGILIPGIAYDRKPPMTVTSPTTVYKRNAPNMKPEIVLQIKTALASRGYDPDGLTGEFDLATQIAVTAFQNAEGLVVDGEVGPETAGALGLSLTTNTTPNATAAAVNATTPKPTNPLLALLLALLAKEEPMPAQSTDAHQQTEILRLLVALLLRNGMGDSQDANTQSLENLLSGRTTRPGQQTSDELVSVLLRLVSDRLNAPYDPVAGRGLITSEAQQPQPLAKPSLQLSIAGVAATSILQALGLVGTPFGLGASPSSVGTFATLIPLLTGLFGATNGFGTLQRFAQSLLGVSAASPRP